MIKFLRTYPKSITYTLVTMVVLTILFLNPMWFFGVVLAGCICAFVWIVFSMIADGTGEGRK